jgi:hypothetical protein
MAEQPRLGVDPYAVLGVPRDATDADIRRAYRAMARRYHPDATGAGGRDAALFDRATAAYELLRDPVARGAYDRTLGSGGAPGPRVVHRAPGPTGHTQVRGPGANLAHKPRPAPPARVREEVDEGRLLGRVLLVVGAIGLGTILLLAGLVLVASGGEPDPSSPPGVLAEYCESPDGWVPCTSLVQR